jgi:hypothetical protein
MASGTKAASGGPLFAREDALRRFQISDGTDHGRDRFRRSVYLLLIFIGTGAMLGRILAVDSIDKAELEKTRLRTIDADRERTRRTLAAKGLAGEALQRELARLAARWQEQARLRRPFLSANDRSRWCTVRALVEDDMRVQGVPYAIDKVIQEQNWDTIDMVKHDGHLFSSKPPLGATLIAAAYWLIYRLTGATLGTNPYEIGRCLLVLFNLVPLVIYFLLLMPLIERFGTTDWGRIFVMAAAVFATFLTTFVVTINNHLPAAVCVTMAIGAVVPIWFDQQRRWRYFFLAGLFGTLAAVSELPAAALLAAIAVLLFRKAPAQTLIAFVPPALLVLGAFFGTNWIAHGRLEPAYAHRADDWYDYTYERGGRQVKSYWQNPVGVDRGEPSPAIYALNVLVGHHGVFSLTPIWFLSAAGMAGWMWRARDPRLRWLAAAVAAISLACLAFYVNQPLMNRNYGGIASGLRWIFWLAPLWLVTMLPAVDAMAGRRWARGLASLLLAVSVLSASYPTWNPWTHPWLTVLSQYLGWGP